ncbi:hypothetical protein D3C81_2234670 [compost metagenome]
MVVVPFCLERGKIGRDIMFVVMQPKDIALVIFLRIGIVHPSGTRFGSGAAV